MRRVKSDELDCYARYFTRARAHPHGRRTGICGEIVRDRGLPRRQIYGVALAVAIATWQQQRST